MTATRLYLTWDRRRADILERLPNVDSQATGAAAAGVGDGGWRFDVDADNMDMYDEMLEDEMTLPPGPVMELHAVSSPTAHHTRNNMSDKATCANVQANGGSCTYPACGCAEPPKSK
ncbi:hypothetical protein EVJ58_g10928 [Rhodofomes roseus]|uniref:Uncharacterized protein n=1 Tax=Rhodofomes roseus TaxID=34475 RepID=A0A4Y9XLV2_9APHY|nr:hypothetical protein EVJ58_g10928 [Rhodofomes roseus]